MGRRSGRKPAILEKVTVLDAVAEGKCIGKIDDKVVFISHVAPGDVVDVRVHKKRKKFFEGTPIKFHEYSKLRIDAFCKHFGTCGGCKWQFLDYKNQLKYKEQQVKDALERIAKVELPEISPILGSAKTKHYRNKLEFTFSNNAWLTEKQISSEEFVKKNALGFHIPGRFDKILDIETCHLQEEPSNSVRLWVKKYAEENHLEFFDLREQTGFLRNLIIRTATTGEWMLILSFAKEDKDKREKMLEELKNAFPDITSLLYVINEKRNDTISDLPIECFYGKDHIIEEMPKPKGSGSLKFKIGPKSFYQTNSDQAYELYKIAADFADLKGSEIVYDLYTGTGTIANFVAEKAKKVIGIEYVPEAIEDAEFNSKMNKLANTAFFAGDMKDVLNNSFIEKHGKADVVITDPPRAGMHSDVVETLKKISAKKIVYVSCNPATQARDIQLLDDVYKLSKVQPVDMFPQTHHVENVVLLEKRS